MPIRTLFAILFLLFAGTVVAQSDKEKAQTLASQAVELMDNGQMDEAIRLLEKAEKLDPGPVIYPYEKAFAYHLKKDYKKAIKILKPLTERSDCLPLVYQLLGNTYDMDGKPDQAIETYEAGLKLFPKAGMLYLERGNMELIKEKYTKALSYYEQGIKADPEFASNYYWASRIWWASENPYWAAIYGELFVNLERNTKRTVEISKQLLDCYIKLNNAKRDSTISIVLSSFVPNQAAASDPKAKGITNYELLLKMAMAKAGNVQYTSLHDIRKTAVSGYAESAEASNALWDYQKKILDAGHFEAYNYWLFSSGDETAFKKWAQENNSAWEKFVEWFNKNQIEITEENKFVRPE